MHTYYGISIYNVSLRDSVADPGSLINAFASHNTDSADVKSIFFNNIPDMFKQALLDENIYPEPDHKSFLKKIEYMVSW